MLANKKIVDLAMRAGFMLSTAYGQDKKKLMPVSDTSTLSEFAKLVQQEGWVEVCETSITHLYGENKSLREALDSLIHAVENNSGYEPSISVLYRAIDEAKELLVKISPDYATPQRKDLVPNGEK